MLIWLKWFCLLGRFSGLVSILFYFNAIYLCHASYAWIQTVFQIIFVTVISHVPLIWRCSLQWRRGRQVLWGTYSQGQPGLTPTSFPRSVASLGRLLPCLPATPLGVFMMFLVLARKLHGLEGERMASAKVFFFF